jgi:hypothetical protein
MMTMTIARWKLVVQVRRQAATPAPDPAQQAVQRVERCWLQAEIARARDRAEARRLLLGGPTAH